MRCLSVLVLGLGVVLLVLGFGILVLLRLDIRVLDAFVELNELESG